MNFVDHLSEHVARHGEDGSAITGELLLPDPGAVRRFLQALYRSAPPTAWIEVRFRLGPEMGQTFHPAPALGAVADAVVAKSAVTDVFVGVVPRSHRGGSRAHLVGRSRVVWADCDNTESVVELEGFRPAPSMVVASGTGQRCHAYWFLREAIDLARMESFNRRLASALGADERCADAARILRPQPGRLTVSMVRLLRYDCFGSSRAHAFQLTNYRPCFQADKRA